MSALVSGSRVMVEIGRAWIRVSAVEGVTPTVSGRTRIFLAGGHSVDVGDIHGSISPDDVVNALARNGT